MFEQMNNNKVHLQGKIISLPRLSHQVYDENFYEIDLEVKRLSSSVDIIPITVSEKLMNEYSFDVGKEIALSGQFRSYNKQVNGKSKLVLTVFVREIVEEVGDIQNTNVIELVGYICKEPVFRTTPFKREICDILLAVNRAYNKSDYLPCIAWGRNARYSKSLEIGDKVNLVGRIQSREYEKKRDDGIVEKKVAYEISILKISKGDSVKNSFVEPNMMFAQQTNDTTNWQGAN